MPSSRVPLRKDGSRDAAIARSIVRTKDTAKMSRVGGDKAAGVRSMLKKAGKGKAEKMYGSAAKTGTKAAASGGSYARNFFKVNSK